MPYSDDALKARIEELEKRVETLETIIESIACGRQWAITRGNATISGRIPLEIATPVK